MTLSHFHKLTHRFIPHLVISKQASMIDKKYPITMGTVRFGLKYDFENEALTVIIYEATNLPAADEGKIEF